MNGVELLGFGLLILSGGLLVVLSVAKQRMRRRNRKWNCFERALYVLKVK